MADISADILIPLVEERGVIWDKTLEIHKDKRSRIAAWREICCVFNPDFDHLDEEERKDFATKVTTKWIHIRDAFMRSQKKEKQAKRTGTNFVRPYVYKDQLTFLLKLNKVRKTRDDYWSSKKRNERKSSIDSNLCSDAILENQFTPAKRKTKEDTSDDKISQFLEGKLRDQDHPHISFIKGVLPSLASFGDDENLEFQTGVLALIQKIKKKRHLCN